MQPQDSGISPAPQCPKSSIKVTCDDNNMNNSHFLLFESSPDQVDSQSLTCNVTSLSSMRTSFVTKSAPIVALYCWLNFLWTYLAESQEYQSTQSTKSCPQIDYICQDTWFLLPLHHLNFNPHTAISTMLNVPELSERDSQNHRSRSSTAQGMRMQVNSNLTATMSVGAHSNPKFHTPKLKRCILTAQRMKLALCL